MNKVVLYEAAIAGGIPIIMPIKTILAGNKIHSIRAILNGTTNYILTKMDADGASYEEVLKEAQTLGYAETDPTGDVEGFDAAYKITTLATIAFNSRIKYENVYREGITKVRKEDIQRANELGYKIKLIATATIDENQNADVRVHPMLVPQKNMLAHIDYVTNAVLISGHPLGNIVLSGPGAGEFPTASSVIGDILSIAREFNTTEYLLPMMRCHHHSVANPVKIEDTYNKYYISITAPNAIGVIAKIGSICANKNISLSSILQKGVELNNTAEITVITEKCLEKSINEIVSELTDCTINSVIRVME
jgi:homoserine dehydrogenase